MSVTGEPSIVTGMAPGEILPTDTRGAAMKNG